MGGKAPLFFLERLFVILYFGDNNLSELLICVLFRQMLLSNTVSDSFRATTALADASLWKCARDSKVT